MSRWMFIAVARPDASPDLAPYPKIVLCAESVDSASARLPESIRGAYTVHAMSARAAARVESAMRQSGRSP